jgi:hypothetical protein
VLATCSAWTPAAIVFEHGEPRVELVHSVAHAIDASAKSLLAALDLTAQNGLVLEERNDHSTEQSGNGSRRSGSS